MAVYQITGPDGTVYRITGPENASREDVIRAIEQRRFEARAEEIRKLQELANRPPSTPPKEPTVAGQTKEFFKGIVPGAIGLAETAGVGISALLPEDAEKAARAKLKEIATAAKAPFEAEAGYEDTVGRKLGAGLGSTLPFFALGPFGLLGRAAGAGLGVSAGAGEARQRAEAEGVTGGDRAIATALGIGPGLLDLVPQLKIAKTLITRAFLHGGIEGATEAAQAVAQNLIAKGVYKPDQPIFVGAGEEGAYGAGVGALASLLVDMTVGRRARFGRDRGTGETGTELAAPAGLAPSATQGDLFPQELRTAETAAMPPAPPALGTQAELFTREEAPIPEAPPAAPPVQEGQMDLFAQPAAEPAAPVQPDMISESETAQIEDMLRAEAITPEVAARNEAEIARLREQEAQRQAESELRGEAELESTDARVADAQRKKTEADRMALLQPIIEDVSIKNIPRAFGKALSDAGYTDLTFTPRELSLINKAYDMRLAEPAAPDVEPDVAAAETEAELEGLIPEKQPKVRQMQQMQLPGVPTPKLPKTAEDVEAAESTVITPQTLDGLGVLKTAPVRQRIIGADVATPEGRAKVLNELTEYVKNPNVKDAPRKKILSFVQSPIFRQQAEMFGPKGGVLKQPAVKEAKDVSATGVEPTAVRTSVPSTARGSEAGAGRVEAPEGTGVGRAGERAGKPETREEPKRPALKEPKKEPKKETPKAEPEKVKEEPGNILWRQLGMAEPEVDFFEGASNQYKTLAPENVGTSEDRTAVAGLLRSAPATLTPIAKAARIYFSKMARNVDNLLNIAFDIAYETPQYRAENESAAEAKFFRGMNERNARLARDWVRQNLSKDSNSFLNKHVNEYMKQRRIDDEKFISALFREGMTSTEHDETVREYLEANKADLIKEAQSLYKLTPEAAIVRPVHPIVAGMLRAGNLTGALRVMSGSLDGMAGKVAGKLIDAVADVKVEVVEGLKDESGNPVTGFYDPATNTIKLDAETGLSSHAVLHETTHAAVSHVLANKAHPVTKQLTQLYNDVKGWLDTAYGATSLDEFVSEAFSNPEFQAKLQAINPKGDKITAWQRFFNTVSNFVRRMVGLQTKPLGSALDSANNLISSILSTAPETRNAGVLYMKSAMGDSRDIFTALDRRYKQAPSWGTGVIDKLDNFIIRSGEKVRDLVTSALPLHAVADLAKPYLSKAPLVDKLVAERAGSENLRNQSIEPILARTETWANKNPEKLDALNTLVYGSTLMQVDPYKPRKQYEGKTDKSGNKLDEAWDMMQSYVKTIGPDGKKIYEGMRDTYKRLYDEIIRVVNARIDDSSDKATADVVKKEIYARLSAKGGLDPYFPLTREGQYWMSYHADGEFYVEAFDSKRERDRAIREYEANGATNVEKFANASQITYRNAPPTSFVNSVLKSLEVNKVDPKVTEEVMRLFLTTLPETSFAQAFRSRKGTLGFKQDAIRALRQKTISISRQLANMEYGAKLAKLRDELNEEFRASGSKEEAKPYLDALTEHIQFAVSPQIPKWSKIARSFGFNMTLGFNVSSAVVNLAQVPLVVMPYLGGRYGYANTTQAIARATKLYTQSGFSRNVETFLSTAEKRDVEKTIAAPSLDNYDFDAKGTPPEIKRLKTLADVAGRLGQLNRSQLYDTLEVTDPKGSVLDRINAASGFVFHHGERMNRQIAMIAAYELELGRMQKEGRKLDQAAMTEAAETAVYLTELTNGGTAAAAAPRIAQSGLGAVMFMFKRYGASMYYLLFKTAREGIQGKNKAEAMRQIAGIYGAAALFAGARGLPMFGVAAMIYNMFKDDDEDDFDTATRKFLGEGVYSGAINAATGLDIASRIGLSDLIFRDQKYSESTSVVASLLETMGGPVFGVASRIERGLGQIAEGNTERGIESMLPSAMANVLRAHRYATEGVTTLRGDPIIGDVNAWNVFAQALGFAPAEYTKQLEMNAALKGIDKKVNEEKTKLLRRFYVATRFGDNAEARESINKLVELQRKHPGLGINAKTIIDSMKQHMRTTATMYHGISLSKGMRGELMQNAREYDDGFGEPEYDEEEAG